MALVTEVNAGGRTILSYNFHLESRGDDRLRCSQLNECLADARRYSAGVPLVLAGDFNMDIHRTAAGGAIKQAGFQTELSGRATTPGSFFERGRPIDWIFTRGPVRGQRCCVHSFVTASDHYPLSVQLTFTPN